MRFSKTLLICSFFTHLIFILLSKPVLTNDEMIILNISNQPFLSIINIIAAERHPPLSYVLFHFLPPVSTTVMRIILIVISYSLIYLIIKFLNQNTTKNKYTFDISIALFISSYTFLFMSSDLKRQLIAIPLLIASMAFSYVYLQKKSIHLKIFFILNTLLIATLLTDYISYFYAVLTFTVIATYFRNKIVFFYTTILQSLSFSVYLLLFGLKQIQFNTLSLEWVTEFANAWHNNFLLTFLSHLGGKFIVLSIFILVTLIFTATTNLKFHIKNKRLIVLFIVLLALSSVVPYFLHLFVRSRYSFFPFLLIGVAAAHGIKDLKLKSHHVSTLLVIVFFVGFGSYVDSRLSLNSFTYDLLMQLNLLTKDGDSIGFLTNGQNVFPKTFQHYYLQNTNVVPINAANMKVFPNPKTITRDDILAIRSNNMANNLGATISTQNISRIVYLFINYPNPPHDVFGEAVRSNCSHKSTIPLALTANAQIYNCSKTPK